MFLIGLARLGRDAELRFMPDGKPVLNLALAFNYGKKDANNQRPTQWIDGAMFGERAQKLAPYLLKGTLIEVHLADPHIETYAKNDGSQGFKLVARADHLDFASSPPAPANQQQSSSNQARAAQTHGPAATRAASQAPPRNNSFADMDDDIPF